MTVYRQKGRDGRKLETWYYRFMVAGKDYHGSCVGCSTIEQAREYEAKMRQTVGVLKTQKNVKALVENFRDELSAGEAIPLASAFDLADAKPKRRKAGDKQTEVRRSMFASFVDYMARHRPEAKTLRDVTRLDAEKYATELGTRKISARTVNRYIAVCEWVFRVLGSDAGMHENPFDAIPTMAVDAEDREAFTEAELKTIMEKADGFTRPLFIIGLYTALREGDIATLKWSEVDRASGVIRRRTRKTGRLVEIPIMPMLDEYLAELQTVQDAGGYVLPEHARMATENPTGISYRVKKFLEKECNIKTTRKNGAGRNVSIKDIHSLRHTFCYLAGMAGIPLVVVQGIVGHMTKEMTAHYSAHADMEAKRSRMEAIPELNAKPRQRRRILTEQARRRIAKAVQDSDDATLEKMEVLLGISRMNRSAKRSISLGKSISDALEAPQGSQRK